MNKKAFTFVELIVVLTIIVIISTIIYANFEGFNRRGEIMNSSGKVYDNLRTAQSYGVSGKTVGGKVTYGWGVNVDRTTNKAILFSDYNNNGKYDYPSRFLLHGTEAQVGSIINESSTYNQALTLMNGANKGTTTGQPYNYLNDYWNFDGSDDYITSDPYRQYYLEPGSFAIDTWFYIPTSIANGATIIYVGDGSTHHSFRYYINSGHVRFDYYDQDTNIHSVESTVTVDANAWYHTSVVRDKEKGVISLFLGKQGVDSQVGVASTTALTSTSSNIFWGMPMEVGRAGTAGTYWKGYLDDLRIILGTPYYATGYSFPSVEASNNIELVRTLKLPPGVVFQRLYNNLTATSTANIVWRTSDPSHYTRVDNAIASSSIILNHAGAENSGTDRDTPATTTISNGGAFDKFGF